MLRIGCHLPSSKGYLEMGKHAVSLGANTFAFLPAIHEAERQNPSKKMTSRHFLPLQKRMTLTIW